MKRSSTSRAVATSVAARVARQAVANLPADKKGARGNPKLLAVYVLEVRVPIEHDSDFVSEHLEDSLISYGSCDVIDKSVVPGEL